MNNLPNAMHLHLMLNHAPLFGELFASGLLLAAAVFRNKTLLRTALSVVLLTGVATIPVFLSGRQAADAIGKVEGIDQEAIDPHEDAAERFLIVAEAAALAAIAGLVWPGRVTIGVAGLLTLLSLGQAGLTADRGGLIHHNELRQHVAAREVRGQPGRGLDPNVV